MHERYSGAGTQARTPCRNAKLIPLHLLIPFHALLSLPTTMAGTEGKSRRGTKTLPGWTHYETLTDVRCVVLPVAGLIVLFHPIHHGENSHSGRTLKLMVCDTPEVIVTYLLLARRKVAVCLTDTLGITRVPPCGLGSERLPKYLVYYPLLLEERRPRRPDYHALRLAVYAPSNHQQK